MILTSWEIACNCQSQEKKEVAVGCDTPPVLEAYTLMARATY